MKTPRLLLAAALLCLVWACAADKGTRPAHQQEHHLPDTLLVGTINGPTSFFTLRGDTLGYEYERMNDFAADHHVGVKFVTAPNMRELVDMLEDGDIDVAAVEIPVTAEFKAHVLNCGAMNETHQVLVQPVSDSVLTNVTQLVGRDVYVIAGSRYEARLKNLNSELGGGIVVHTIDNDTVNSDDLVDMVASGKLPLTVIDSDLGQLCKTYNDSIDISLKVSFEQRTSWAVNKRDTWLADTIDAWAASDKTKKFSKEVKRRYFELSRVPVGLDMTSESTHVKPGEISPYDHLFKKYAAQAGVDWLLLAAICKVESGFHNNVQSWAGARGIMQVMPSVGRAYGYTADELNDPEKNIDVACQSLVKINEYLKPLVADKGERLRFVLASYNAGIGHISDAIALAKKYGRNPQLWYGNVEEAALMKSRPEYYNDPVCRHGYFRAKETVAYVKKVEESYRVFRQKSK